MTTEKYRVNLKKVLAELTVKSTKNVGLKNIIPFSEKDLSLGKIKKVAFDMYKVVEDPYKDLWILEDVNGVPHLVRASDPHFEETKSGDWSAASDYDKRFITLSYKNIPITNFFSDDYGYISDDIGMFKEAILEKVADEKFISEVLKQQPLSKIEALSTSFPELSKFIK